LIEDVVWWLYNQFKDSIWIVIRRRDSEARKTEKQGLLFLCDFHKLVFLILSVERFNCHVSSIGGKTGEKGG
jgi:hypothetical protein